MFFFFWNSIAFSMIQCMLAIWSLVPLPFLNPALTSKFLIHILLKPSLENFKHYFASVWDKCNYAVNWMFFVIAFLWDWNENYLFQFCGYAYFSKFAGIIECNSFTTSDFRTWNSSPGIPSPPLALFVVMLSKAHLTSDSRMPGSRWMFTPSF